MTAEQWRTRLYPDEDFPIKRVLYANWGIDVDKFLEAFSAEQNAALTREVTSVRGELQTCREAANGLADRVAKAEREVADLRAQLAQVESNPAKDAEKGGAN